MIDDICIAIYDKDYIAPKEFLDYINDLNFNVIGKFANFKNMENYLPICNCILLFEKQILSAYILNRLEQIKAFHKIIIFTDQKLNISFEFDYAFDIPFDLDFAAETIRAIAKKETIIVNKDISLKAINKQTDLRPVVSQVLYSIQITPNLKGFHYLRDAIIMTVKNAFVLKGIMKSLYPAIAVKYSSTNERVERSIRHAIEVCFTKAELNYIQKIFGNTVSFEKSRPTNSEFIARIADHINISLLPRQEDKISAP